MPPMETWNASTTTPKPVLCMQQHAIMPNSYTRFSGKSPQHLCQSRTSPAKTEPKFSETWNVAACFFACPAGNLATNSSPVERAKQKCWKKFELLLCIRLCCNYMKSLMCFCFVWLCFHNDLFQNFYFAYIDTLWFSICFTLKTKSCGHVDVNEMSVQCLKTTWPCNTIQNVDQTANVEDYKALTTPPNFWSKSLAEIEVWRPLGKVTLSWSCHQKSSVEDDLASFAGSRLGAKGPGRFALQSAKRVRNGRNQINQSELTKTFIQWPLQLKQQRIRKQMN